MAALVLATVPAAGQAPKAAPNAKDRGAVRNVDFRTYARGQPDLQGVWDQHTLTTLASAQGARRKEYYTESDGGGSKRQLERLAVKKLR